MANEIYTLIYSAENGDNETRVALKQDKYTSWEPVIDVRNHFTPKGSKVMVPTGKGAYIPADQLDDLIASLEAFREANAAPKVVKATRQARSSVASATPAIVASPTDPMADMFAKFQAFMTGQAATVTPPVVAPRAPTQGKANGTGRSAAQLAHDQALGEAAKARWAAKRGETVSATVAPIAATGKTCDACGKQITRVFTLNMGKITHSVCRSCSGK